MIRQLLFAEAKVAAITPSRNMAAAVLKSRSSISKIASYTCRATTFDVRKKNQANIANAACA